jgi:hypothetical protein
VEPVHLRNAVSYLARTRVFDRIVALDDFDVELAAMLREHLRIPGMGETTVRYFRDKLAMRMRAAEMGLNVPDFHSRAESRPGRGFLDRVPPPWVLKPRSMAGAIGIRKVHSKDEFWGIVESLGDEQSGYLLERFVPGDIFHVDTIMSEREVVFAIASGYGTPPLEVAHGGGIFTTRILERDSDAARRLLEENRRVLAALGLLRGVSHTEYIIGREDGRVYFLETSARVGGAHIAELVEAASGHQSVGRVGQGGNRRRQGAVCPARAARGLRRADRFAGAPGASRYVAIRRPRNRLAHVQGAPRRPDRAVAEPRARARTARRLRCPRRTRLPRVGAPAGSSRTLACGTCFSLSKCPALEKRQSSALETNPADTGFCSM